jgi:hypothetical protein
MRLAYSALPVALVSLATSHSAVAITINDSGSTSEAFEAQSPGWSAVPETATAFLIGLGLAVLALGDENPALRSSNGSRAIHRWNE